MDNSQADIQAIDNRFKSQASPKADFHVPLPSKNQEANYSIFPKNMSKKQKKLNSTKKLFLK